jgi:hypothetical protein
MPTETEVNEAHRVLRADYWSDVRNVAEEFLKMWHAGDFDGDRDEAIEWIDQSVDGAARVIYTAQAADCLRYSDHDDAGIDELGAESFNFKDGFPWSQLAYFAFRADIIEQIGSGVEDIDGADINDDPPTKADIAESKAEEASEVQS